MKQSQVDRAARYRKRAGETRSKADGMTESFSRRTMLEVAETWERLAAKELTPDAPPHNPSIVSEAHQTSVAPPTRAREEATASKSTENRKTDAQTISD